MSTDQFSAPASTQGIDWQTSKGHLLLVTPLAIETGVATVHGPTDAIRADITDLEDGSTYTDVLVFPKVLQGQLRSKIGGKVLGRLGQGTAKPGQSAPWVLQDFTPEDAAKASAWIAQQTQPTFTAASSGTASGGGFSSDAPF